MTPNIKRIKAVFFSPCGSTEQIIRRMAAWLSDELQVPAEVHSYTLPQERRSPFVLEPTDLLLWGTPVYAGRIPNMLLPFVKQGVTAGGNPAIPVVVFGNRSYDHALAEVSAILKKQGCLPLAGAALAARHVFTPALAPGRPDSADWNRLQDFCRAAAEKIKGGTPWSAPEIPGEPEPEAYYTPKKADGTPAVFLKAKPQADPALCNVCGICQDLCPMGIIRQQPGAVPEFAGICIKCHACIRGCPKKAIALKDEAFLSHVEMLAQSFTARKEPEFFL